jgi:hypothetical protein
MDAFILSRSGILNNVHVSKFTVNGFSYVYNKSYSHITKSSEMDEIKNSCLPISILCVGGRDSTTDILLVVACGLCSVVLSKIFIMVLIGITALM